MTLQLIIISLITIYLTSGASAITLDRWIDLNKKENINLQDLRDFINNENCYKNEHHFLGCMATINLLSAQKTVSEKTVTYFKPDINSIKTSNYPGSKTNNKTSYSKEFKENLYNGKNGWKRFFVENYLDAGTFFNFEQKLEEIFPIAVSSLKENAENKGKDIDVVNRTELLLIIYSAQEYLNWLFDGHAALLDEKDLSADDVIFFGIGAELLTDNNYIVIKKILPDSPAEKYGLIAGDTITAIKEDSDPKAVSIKDWSVTEVSEKIKGKENTAIELTIKRNENLQILKVLRGKVIQKVMQTKMLPNEVLHISLSSFMKQSSCVDIESSLATSKTIRKKMRKGKRTFWVTKEGRQIRGVILDLRDNLGGRVLLANCIADLFLPQDRAVVGQKNIFNGQIKWEKTTGSEYFKIPLVLLINGSSASASEILAGAFRDHNRAIVIGTKSFGKGTVQQVFPYNRNNFSSWPLTRIKSLYIKYTTARFYNPIGMSNQIVGISPHITVNTNSGLSFANENSIANIPSADGTLVNATPPQSLSHCIDVNGKSTEKYDATKNKYLIDRQMETAVNAINCMITENITLPLTPKENLENERHAMNNTENVTPLAEKIIPLQPVAKELLGPLNADQIVAKNIWNRLLTTGLKKGTEIKGNGKDLYIRVNKVFSNKTNQPHRSFSFNIIGRKDSSQGEFYYEGVVINVNHWFWGDDERSHLHSAVFQISRKGAFVQGYAQFQVNQNRSLVQTKDTVFYTAEDLENNDEVAMIFKEILSQFMSSEYLSLD